MLINMFIVKVPGCYVIGYTIRFNVEAMGNY